jgi:hypothetical protein
MHKGRLEALSGGVNWSAPLPVALYGLVMVAVSLSLGRLRMKISLLAGDAQSRERHQKDVRRNYRLAFLFLIGSASALAHPRLGLLFFVALPIALRVAHSLRTKPSNQVQGWLAQRPGLVSAQLLHRQFKRRAA